MTTINKNIPSLRFKEFEGRWDPGKLNEIAKINPSNKTLPDKFIYIDLESVVKGQLLKEDEILKNESPSRAQRYLHQRDILFQMVRPYQMNNLFFDKIGEYVASTGYAQIRTNENSRFLYHYLHIRKFVNKVIVRCTGTSYPAINSYDLGNIQVSIPSLPEQQKIASFLSSIDEKIQQLTRKKELLEQYKKGVMQQLFSGKLRFRDEKGKAYPEWEETELGNHIDLISGFAFKGEDISEKPGGIPLMRGINITEGYVRHSEDIDRYFHGDVSDLENLQLKEGDLVLGMDGSKVGKNSSLISKVDEGSLLVQRVACIRSLDKSDINFIYQHIRSPQFIKYVDMVNTSSGIPHISSKQIRDFKILFPVKAEQQKIANYLSAIDTKIESVAYQIAQTQTFKKGLLQGMFV